MAYDRRIVFIPFCDDEIPYGDHIRIIENGMSLIANWSTARPGRYEFVQWSPKTMEHEALVELTTSPQLSASIYINGHGRLGYQVMSAHDRKSDLYRQLKPDALLMRMRSMGLTPRGTQGARLTFKLFTCQSGVGDKGRESFGEAMSKELDQQGFGESLTCGYTHLTIRDYMTQRTIDWPRTAEEEALGKEFERLGFHGKVTLEKREERISFFREETVTRHYYRRAKDSRVFFKHGKPIDPPLGIGV